MLQFAFFILLIENLIFLNFNYFQFTNCLLYDAAAAAKSLQSCPTLCDPIDRNINKLNTTIKRQRWSD